MPAPADAGGPDVTEMLAVHRVFRSTCAAAPDLIGTVAASDQHRVELIASYSANVLGLLHAHHLAEDELLWPVLRARTPANLALVDPMAAQHADVVASAARCAAAVDAWRRTGGPTVGTDAGALIAALGVELAAHLDKEEAQVLPLCARVVTEEEWGAMPGFAMAHFEGDKPWLAIGLVREQMTPAQRDRALAGMPPEVRND